MKLQPIDTLSVKSSGIQKTVQFGIKSSGLAHIFNVLRNQLYSDKVKAVIREYSCNAVDAHVDNGCPQRPIEVTLPNSLSPVFKVRDFGKALSELEIQDVYAFYGESTKRNSNDQIGMLGIGSKSAFSYGDSFIIHSFLDGKKFIYNAFIDPSQIGQISKIGEEKTDEENGIEIVIAVDSDDIAEFKEKAVDLFRWFNVCPIIKGVEQFVFEKGNSIFEGDDWQWLSSPSSDSSRYGYPIGHGEPTAVMGNIGYPISFQSLACNDQLLMNLISSNLILKFKIGELEIAASREQLQYSDSTRNKIIAKLRKVKDEVSEQIIKSFNGCPTLFDMKKLYAEVFDYGNSLYSFKNILGKQLQWKGKIVDTNTFNGGHIIGAGNAKLFHVQKTRAHRRRIGHSARHRPSETSYISCIKNTVVYLHDLPDDKSLMGRLLTPITEKGADVYYLKFKDNAIKNQWIKESGFDGELINISSLPIEKLSKFYPKTVTVNGVVRPSKDSKYSTEKFVVDWTEIEEGNRWGGDKAKYFQSSDVDINADSGVYILINKFQFFENEEKVDGTDEKHPHYLLDIRKKLTSIGIALPANLFAFKLKVGDKVKKNPNWISLSKWIANQILEKLENEKLCQKFVDRRAVKAMDSSTVGMLNIFIRHIKFFEKNIVLKDGVFLSLLRKRVEMSNLKSAEQMDTAAALLQQFSEKSLAIAKYVAFDIDGKNKEVQEKYSLLLALNELGNGYYEAKLARQFLDGFAKYVNSIDASDSPKNT